MPLADPAIIQNFERIQVLYSLCLVDSPAEPAFDRLTRLASRIMGVPISVVTIVDANRQYLKSFVGVGEPWASRRETPLSHSFCQHVVASGQPLIINDAREHPLVYDNLAIPDMDVIAYAGMPLTTSDGVTLGSFCVIKNEPHHWTSEQVEILSELSQSVISEIELRSEIIQRERVEVALQQAYERVFELEQVKSDMIRLAAHDLRNPLSGVTGMGMMLLEVPDPLTDRQREMIGIINEGGQRILQIIEDILSLERIEQEFKGGKTVDLSALVQKCFDANRKDAERKRQQYWLQPIAGTIKVQADDAQLHEVIMNLIGNAIKYTAAEQHVKVSLSAADGKAIFEVEDTGIGIPADQQDRLFQPFYRAKSPETRLIDGTGLGLSLVKNIITRYQGQVHVKSEYHKGSTFSFELPLLPD